MQNLLNILKYVVIYSYKKLVFLGFFNFEYFYLQKEIIDMLKLVDNFMIFKILIFVPI